MIRKVGSSELDTTALANLNVESLELADDFCDYSKVIVKKPWGYEYLIFENGTVAVWILYLKSGAETSMHCHPNKKTSLIVLDGHVVCSTLGKQFERSAGEGLLIEKGVFHQTKVVSEEGAFVMEIETPINKRDLLRLKDKYGREGTGYETADKHSTNTQNYNYLSLSTPDVHYNVRKRFGRCTLTFKKLKPADGLQEIFALNDDDVVSVVRGQILDHRESDVIAVGDTMTVRALRGYDKPRVGHDLELLIIKRIDHVIKVSDYVVEFLKAQGVKDVFLVPGDANVHLLDSIGRDEELRFISNQIEKNAAMAAEAYAKASNALGVLVVSSGASGTNALTGVANAWIDSTPMLVISGQARNDQDIDGRVRQLGNKSFDIVSVVKPMTKYAVKVTDPSLVKYYLEKAAHLATEGRPGPVWVDIPIDILGMTIDGKELKSFSAADEFHLAKKPPNDEATRVFALLKKAKRPVLLAGSGIRLSGAEERFLRLAEALKLPVLTSRRGADLFPENHPLFFGRPGTYGQRRANFIIQNCDLLISIGSRLSIPLVGRNTKAFARGAKKVVVDIDRNELEKETIRPDLAVNLSAGAFIDQMLAKTAGYEADLLEWIGRCEDWAKRFPPLAEGYTHRENINPYLFIDTLAGVLNENAVIVADGGSPMQCMMQAFSFKAGQRLISSTGLELPGFAVSGAIGASVAHRQTTIVCLCEDRGLQTSLQELQTIRDRKLPIKIFVLKSQGHDTIRKIQKDFFGGRYVGTDSEILFGAPALSEAGHIYGFATHKITKPDEIAGKVREILAAEGPALCEIPVDNSQEVIPRMGFTVKGDGKWLAKPLEDMYPPLDRKTLRELMIIDLLEEE